MEFRIFHNIFCDSYKIQRKAFAFEEYVEKVFEKFVMEVIEIRPLDWIILSILFVLNLARYSTHLTFSEGVCDDHDYACKDEGLTQVFLLAGNRKISHIFSVHFLIVSRTGGILFAVSILMALSTRRLELNIMKIKGISGIDSYYSYLTHMEGRKEKVEANVRMGMDQLRVSQSAASGMTKLINFYQSSEQLSWRKIRITMKTTMLLMLVSY
jgi:flagellar biosynthesis protein FlhB